MLNADLPKDEMELRQVNIGHNVLKQDEKSPRKSFAPLKSNPNKKNHFVSRRASQMTHKDPVYHIQTEQTQVDPSLEDKLSFIRNMQLAKKSHGHNSNKFSTANEGSSLNRRRLQQIMVQS